MRETEIFNVPAEVMERLLPDTFEFIKEKFRAFVEDGMNSVTVEDYRDWRKFGFVEIVVNGNEVSYTPFWPKKEIPGNDLPWTYDKVEDIEEALGEIEKYWIE